jgi:hypothetical protein
MWWLLKSELAKRPFINLENFKNDIRQIWSSISIQTCRNMIDSMPRRIRAMEQNDYYVTKY